MEELDHNFRCSSIERFALFKTPVHLSIYLFSRYLLHAPCTGDVILIRNSWTANNLIHIKPHGQGYNQGRSKELRGGALKERSNEGWVMGYTATGKLPTGAGIGLTHDG